MYQRPLSTIHGRDGTYVTARRRTDHNPRIHVFSIAIGHDRHPHILGVVATKVGDSG